MRISDWSSDVCSSDLDIGQIPKIVPLFQSIEMLRHVGDHLVGQMTRVRARISDSAGFIEFLKNIKRLLGGPAPSRRSGHLKLRQAVGCRRRKCLRLLFNFEVRGDASRAGSDIISDSLVSDALVLDRKSVRVGKEGFSTCR